jgi:hypothetical protein
LGPLAVMQLAVLVFTEAAMHSFLVNIRTPAGRYITLTVAAYSAADAGAAAVDIGWWRRRLLGQADRLSEPLASHPS